MDRGRYGEEPVRMFCNGEKKKKAREDMLPRKIKSFSLGPTK